jgi:peptide deformylase
MSILKVARMGHPILRTKALPIAPGEIGSAAIQQLIDDMLDTMREYAGIGLAAPQVHVNRRVFVAGLRRPEAAEGASASAAPEIPDMDDDHDMPMVAIINPELTFSGTEIEEAWEGCLSIPDIRGMVARPTEVRVRGYDRAGRRIAFAARGLPARVIQHETDHLDGVLFFDRMRSLDTLTFMDEYQRFWSKHEDE